MRIFTDKHTARTLKNLRAVLNGAYGEEARSYMIGYFQLWKHYRQLKHQGVNVRISPPKRGRRRPLLVIDK